MDQYDMGVDPEVKKYFRQIINSFSVGMLWLMVLVLLGLVFKLGLIKNGLSWKNILFYMFFLGSLIAIIYYLYRVWKKEN